MKNVRVTDYGTHAVIEFTSHQPWPIRFLWWAVGSRRMHKFCDWLDEQVAKRESKDNNNI